MKHLRLLSLGLVFVMVITPLAAFAQDDDEIELVEFTTEDGLLTIGYPEEWFIEGNVLEEDGVPGAMLASSEDALTMMLSDETDTNLAEGETGIAVLILPIDMLMFMGIEVPAEGELDLAAAVTSFLESTIGEDTDPEEVEISEAETIEVGEGDEAISVGYIEFSDPDVEGAMWLFEVNEGVLALVFAGAYPGEFSDELEEIALAVAESIEFTATGDELFAILMGGGDMGMLDGEALVAERCTVCHSRERIDAAVKDEAGWTTTVERMIGNGAVLSDEEKAAVIEYLSGMGGDTGALDGEALVAERCTVCHSRERIDAADKDEAGWTTTVERMIGNGAVLSDEEKAAVIAYLVESH